MSAGYNPIYKISRNGLDITGHFNDRTTMIRVDFSSGDGDDDKCFITLDDRDWAIARPNTGETLSIELGYKEVGLAYMGEYTIEEVTFSLVPKMISLAGTASGAFQAMRAPIIKNFDKNTKLGEVFSEIAKDGGVSLALHPTLADKVLGEGRNITTSPYMAAQELGRQFNAVAKIANGKLIVTPHGGGESASGQAMPTLVLGPAHFGMCAVKHTERAQYGGVKAAYFDSDKNERAFVEEKSPLSGDGSSKPFVPNRMFGSKQEAEAAAKAQMQAITRSRGNADITLAKGDPWIKDQQKLLIRGCRDGINDSYVTELVSHSYQSETGIHTSMKARPTDDGGSFETLFTEATEAQKKELFLEPKPGALMGEVLRDQSLPPAFNRLLQ